MRTACPLFFGRTMAFIVLSFVMFQLGEYTLRAQAKYEKESRVNKDDVPQSALSFLENSAVNSKVKWYKETRLEGYSFEAKTKMAGEKYSIEFDSAGVVEDIEIQIEWEEIAQEAQMGICSYLEDFADIFKIRKIQRQYTGPAAVLMSILSIGPVSVEATERYEVVADVKKGKEREKYEFLFSKNGELIRQYLIVDRITDNLEY